MAFGYNVHANGIRQHLIRYAGPEGAPELLVIPGITSPAITWGFVAERAPMIATEIGWANENEHGAHVPTINNDHTYGPNIVDYLSSKGISWTVWAFDPEWAPTMIKNWDFEPTEQGAFFKKVLQGKYKGQGL